MSAKKSKMPICETPILLEEVVTSKETDEGFYQTENGVLFDGIVTVGIVNEIYRNEKKAAPSLKLMDEHDTVNIYASPSKFSQDAIRKIDRIFQHDFVIVHGRFSIYTNKKGETIPQINIASIESISLRDPINLNKFRQGFYLEVLKQRAKNGIKMKNVWGISKTAKDFKIPQKIDGDFFTVSPPKELKAETILSPKKESEEKKSEKKEVEKKTASPVSSKVIPKKTTSEMPVKSKEEKTEKSEAPKKDESNDLTSKIMEMLKKPDKDEKGRVIGRSFADIASECGISQKDVAKAIMSQKEKISVFSHNGTTRMKLKE